jgi:hypothetical protein
LEYRKPRNSERRSGPSVLGTRGSDRSHRERSRQEVVHRVIANREIADPVDEWSLQFETRGPILRKVESSVVEASCHRGSGYRESREHSNKSCEIAKRDFPMGRGTAGPTEGSTVDRWQIASRIGISRVPWTKYPCTTKSRTPKMRRN